MYKLLIVDNEKVIVDGLVAYFKELKTLNVEVYGAYSGSEALNVLEEVACDVVLSDIRMPRMSGLQLQREVTSRWPHCRFVFLSAYDDFSYAQQALRGGASNYILKTEGYEAIAEAVSTALTEVADMNRIARFLSVAKKQWRTSWPLLQEKCMRPVLRGNCATRHRPLHLPDIPDECSDPIESPERQVLEVSHARDIVQRIHEYIGNHLGDDLSLTAIGEALNYNPYYLSRLYKQLTGQGLAEYVQEARLEKAKQLLCEGDLTIYDVSQAIGFVSENYFYRFFKKHTGMTPREYVGGK
ncbi:response regulator transcription factor [Numidum massiliense]|uniref:response regulator transcription factor n=1 Tax=Numidum massiliense TaxID=1522315 RepID=UPI0006D55A96|nr:response regulator [Numidum massiliense]